MARGTVNADKLERRIPDIEKLVTIGASIAEERGAEILKSHLQRSVPVVTGRLESSFQVRKGVRGYWVVIPRRKFPGFFYALNFLWLFHETSRRVTPEVKSAMRRSFLDWFRTGK